MSNYYKVEWMTQEFLKETFTYCESGNLIWRHDRPLSHFASVIGYNVYQTQRAGIIAGKIAINEKPYRGRREGRDTRIVMITYKGQKKNFPVHKLIFLYHHGYLPDLIDHIDSNYLNNKIENLQELNPQLNVVKARMFSHNTTGYRGVRYRPRDNKYIVNIKVNGQGCYCGQYDNIHYAAMVYNYVSTTLFGEYAFTNKIEEELHFNVNDIDNIFFSKHLPLLIVEMDNKYGRERKYSR